MSKKVLIVSFFFPPYKRVGGRRWAKFAKYLDRRGNIVKIICAQLSSSDSSPWDEDVKALEKDIIRIPIEHKIPFFRRNMNPTTLLGKIRYRLSALSYKNRIRSVKGDMHDLSIGYADLFSQKTGEILGEGNIKNVVLSGGPFRYISKTIQLKKKYPQVRFIIDLRDLWSDNMTTLTEERRMFEETLEKESLQLADQVITPAERIKDHLETKYSFLKNKITVVPHAYDEDDFRGMSDIKTQQSETLRIIYAGSLYAEMQVEMRTLASLVAQLKQNGTQVQVDLYTFQADYKNIFEESGMGDLIKYHQPIGSKELFQKIKKEYDAVLILLSGRAMTQHFKSSKYYELIHLGKPLIYIGPQGDVSDFTEKEQLGFYVHAQNIQESALRIAENKNSEKIPNHNFPIENFSFEKVAQQLENILA